MEDYAVYEEEIHENKSKLELKLERQKEDLVKF